MNPENPYAPPNATLVKADAAAREKLEGIGGWLILVGLGVVFSPIRIVKQVIPSYVEMISNGSWAALTTPGSASYSPAWLPILLLESTINCALIVAWVVIAIQFFTKKARFPKLYISILCFTIVFQLFDAWVITLVRPSLEVFDRETVRELGRSVVAALIWIPYMLRSKRVKATFVN